MTGRRWGKLSDFLQSRNFFGWKVPGSLWVILNVLNNNVWFCHDPKFNLRTREGLRDTIQSLEVEKTVLCLPGRIQSSLEATKGFDATRAD